MWLQPQTDPSVITGQALAEVPLTFLVLRLADFDELGGALAGHETFARLRQRMKAAPPATGSSCLWHPRMAIRSMLTGSPPHAVRPLILEAAITTATGEGRKERFMGALGAGTQRLWQTNDGDQCSGRGAIQPTLTAFAHRAHHCFIKNAYKFVSWLDLPSFQQPLWSLKRR
jgi:hypothetical protein